MINDFFHFTLTLAVAYIMQVIYPDTTYILLDRVYNIMVGYYTY